MNKVTKTRHALGITVKNVFVFTLQTANACRVSKKQVNRFRLLSGAHIYHVVRKRHDINNGHPVEHYSSSFGTQHVGTIINSVACSGVVFLQS